jgi:hypothetical protein
MDTWVVYDSLYGNTERVAKAVAAGLGDAVGLLRVDEATPEVLTGVRTLVLGCPTHRFSPTPAMAALLTRLRSAGLAEVRVAAFDTRFGLADMPSPVLTFFVRLAGARAYAATHVLRALKRAGGHVLRPPEGFLVKGTEGPLLTGELERATAWGRNLAEAAGSTSPSPA